MMVGVQDIAALLPDEVGDVTHQSLAVGTLDEQSRSLSGFGHGRREPYRVPRPVVLRSTRTIGGA
jgi:hypothetical protein